MISGAEYTSTVDELQLHTTQEVARASTLAEQAAFVGGTPETQARLVPPFVNSKERSRSI